VIAVLLCAGTGSRLRPLTNKVAKCMLQFRGKSLLDHQLEILRRHGCENIVIVGGGNSHSLRGDFDSIIFNKFYESTNMIYSLSLAADLIINSEDDLLITYGDIFFEGSLIGLLAGQSEMIVPSNTNWLNNWKARMTDIATDAETFYFSDDFVLKNIGDRLSSCESLPMGQFMGILYIPARFASAIVSELRKISVQSNISTTEWLNGLVNRGYLFKVVEYSGEWFEVDTVADYEFLLSCE